MVSACDGPVLRAAGYGMLVPPEQDGSGDLVGNHRPFKVATLYDGENFNKAIVRVLTMPVSVRPSSKSATVRRRPAVGEIPLIFH